MMSLIISPLFLTLVIHGALALASVGTITLIALFIQDLRRNSTW